MRIARLQMFFRKRAILSVPFSIVLSSCHLSCKSQTLLNNSGFMQVFLRLTILYIEKGIILHSN